MAARISKIAGALMKRTKGCFISKTFLKGLGFIHFAFCLL
jgi:hypothetical protein